MLFMNDLMVILSGHFCITESQALISSTRLLSFVSAKLHFIVNTHLFLLSHCIPQTEHKKKNGYHDNCVQLPASGHVSHRTHQVTHHSTGHNNIHTQSAWQPCLELNGNTTLSPHFNPFDSSYVAISQA